jgi:mono/diheme cytochrome c family protein
VAAFAVLASAQPGPPDPTVQQVYGRGDCARCHEVPGTEALARTESCTTCHLWIRKVAANPSARDKAMAIFPKWERYERNVATYLQVPSLTAGMARLEPEWVRSWIADPHDIRPYLPEGMPRFDLGEEDLDLLEAAFREALVEVPATPAPDRANIRRGAQLFEDKGCVVCHAVGGAQRPVTPFPMAPDLAHARDRLSPDMAVAWIQDPTAISPDATMPTSGATLEEAIALRDYLFLVTLKTKPPPPAGPDPVAAKEPVTWAQVEERVIGKICIHCHMDPDLNEGRAGPGNAGGFGWGATGIELQSVEGVIAVADRIPAVLLRRRHEARRDTIGLGQHPAVMERDAKPGMPLGLPPIPDEDIALILGWIEQGMPRE